MNHHHNPNAIYICTGEKNSTVVKIKLIRDVAAGDEICTNYGEWYFIDRQCLCPVCLKNSKEYEILIQQTNFETCTPFEPAPDEKASLVHVLVTGQMATAELQICRTKTVPVLCSSSVDSINWIAELKAANATETRENPRPTAKAEVVGLQLCQMPLPLPNASVSPVSQ